MKLLLTSAGVKNAEHPRRAWSTSGQTDYRGQRALYSDRDVRQARPALVRRGASSTDELPPHDRIGLESPSECSSSRRYPVLVKHIGSDGSKRPTFCW